MRHKFQWSDDELECKGYASSGTISSVKMGFVSVNTADGNDCDLQRHMEAQEEAMRAQLHTLDNIQLLWGQILSR